MPHIVFLNGPPGCGKDTAVSHLVPYIDFQHLKFAAPIKRMVGGLFNKDMRWVEENKDRQHSALRHDNDTVIAQQDSLRTLLIELSEAFIKPRYGDEFFGRIAFHEIMESTKELIIFSDSGFASEASPILRRLTMKNCIKIEIHRPGRTFVGDSRSYWQTPLTRTYRVVNDSTIHDLTMRVLRVIIKTFNPPLLREPDWIK